MPEIIPRDELGRIEWMLHLVGWLELEGVGHGFTPAEIAAFKALATDADGAFARCMELRAAAHAGTVTKKKAIAAALERARAFVRRIQSHPNTTDADRSAAKIRVPDLIPTPMSPDAILLIDPPLVILDHSVPRQVAIHWGPNPHNEKHNGRPAGVQGVVIEFARGGIPDTEAGWMILEQATRSPYIHAVEDNTPTTYAYRARYVGLNLKYGPHGQAATCTVSV